MGFSLLAGSLPSSVFFDGVRRTMRWRVSFPVMAVCMAFLQVLLINRADAGEETNLSTSMPQYHLGNYRNSTEDFRWQWYSPSDTRKRGSKAVSYGGGFTGPLILIHRRISLEDGARCTYYPTCSSYCVRAVRRYGPLGLFICMERLLRDMLPNMTHDHYYHLIALPGRHLSVDIVP